MNLTSISFDYYKRNHEFCLSFEKAERKKMSKICQLTGKTTISGNNVSKSNRKVKRKFYANIQTKKFFVPELNKWITLKLSTSAIRTLDKKGVHAYLKELEKKEGFNFKKLLTDG